MSKKVLLLSEDDFEAKRTQELLQGWGWEHVVVCGNYHDIVTRLKSNPFGYTMVVIEKIYEPELEGRLLDAIEKAHSRVPILIRSKWTSRAHIGRVTFLGEKDDFDALVDTMGEIYRDERKGFESHVPASLIKSQTRATIGNKVVPFKVSRKPFSSGSGASE